MPAARQNALVQKYCTVCHTDAARNGGLSLEHFDASHAAPSLTAMMLNKMTGGVALERARAVDADSDAAAMVNKEMRHGAIGAAGLGIPDRATIDQWIRAFAAESARAAEWSVESSPALVSASVLREWPAATTSGLARAYRLTASCAPADHAGSMQLSWSPAPRNGTLTVAADGGAVLNYAVQGAERMGNGSGVVSGGAAAVALDRTEGKPLPVKSLTAGGLFPGETVEFSFADLPPRARVALETCFPQAR